jgi:hypothetical protein
MEVIEPLLACLRACVRACVRVCMCCVYVCVCVVCVYVCVGPPQVGCRGRLALACRAALHSMRERRKQYLNGTEQQCIDMLDH